MRYAHPGTPGALVSFQATYANYIAGNFTEPLSGQYFMNTSGRRQRYCPVPALRCARH